jgi:Flp pilus assembly pilin Flp
MTLRKKSQAQDGQATVEYVGLAVAVAVLLVAMGSGLSPHGDKLGGAVAKKLTSAVGAVGG